MRLTSRLSFKVLDDYCILVISAHVIIITYIPSEYHVSAMKEQQETTAKEENKEISDDGAGGTTV